VYCSVEVVARRLADGRGVREIALVGLALAARFVMLPVIGGLAFNTLYPVVCNPQFSATRGSGGIGGTTNCVEP
jgi:hypothetical protein